MKTIMILLILCVSSGLYTSSKTRNETYVYICTSLNAYSYHCYRDCRGLNKCRAEIKSVTLEYAKSKNRRACKICYK